MTDNSIVGSTVGREPSDPKVLKLVPDTGEREDVRIIEALIFASAAPVSERALAEALPGEADIPALLGLLQERYAGRGVTLEKRGSGWAFRTAPDLAYLLERHAVSERRLSRAALETLSIIAYHQPVTRAEIEEIRGVATSKGTLDVLLETGWVRLRGRRRAPGRPVTFGVTEAFLDHFGLESMRDLPGLAELKGAGLLDSDLPPDFVVPQPRGLDGLEASEDPLEDQPQLGDGVPEPEDGFDEAGFVADPLDGADDGDCDEDLDASVDVNSNSAEDETDRPARQTD